MTERLTQQLHAASAGLALTARPAPELRAHAERARRIRRGLGGAAVIVVVLAVVTTSLLATRSRSAPPANEPTGTTRVEPTFYELMFGRDQNIVIISESSVPIDRSNYRLEMSFERAIASQRGRCPDSPGQCLDSSPDNSDGELYSLAEDPILVDGELRIFEQLSVMMSGSGTWDRVPASDARIPKLTNCIPEPASLGANTIRAGAWDATNLTAAPSLGVSSPPIAQAYLNEFVLQFDSVSAAAAAYANLHAQAVNCPSTSDYTQTWLIYDESPTAVGGWPVDEAFISEFQRPK